VSFLHGVRPDAARRRVRGLQRMRSSSWQGPCENGLVFPSAVLVLSSALKEAGASTVPTTNSSKRKKEGERARD
jgi:hypothetical protein